MGCDIWTHIERYNKVSKRWEELSLYKETEDGMFKPVDVYDGRDYELFGILAGVRSMIEPFVRPRGLPDDPSCEVQKKYGDGEYFHDATWYDYCELEAYSYMMSDAAKEIKRKNSKIRELERQVKELKHDDDDDYYIDEYLEYDDEHSVAERLSGFMEDIRRVLDAYDIWYPKPGEVRVIMWFDS